MSKPTYIIHLQPLPRVDGVQSLRAALKVLLRRFGLRCVSATVADTTTTTMGDAPAKEIKPCSSEPSV